MKIIDYIKEHKSLIIIITILIAAFILIGVLIFNGNEDQNYNRKYDESKTKYKINEVVPIYVNQEQMAKKYLSEYVNLIVFDEEKDNYKIRKLTPLECWRLMGFEDEDFYKAQSLGVSDSQLYKQAGNSIVTNVVYYIFKNLL